MRKTYVATWLKTGLKKFQINSDCKGLENQLTSVAIDLVQKLRPQEDIEARAAVVLLNTVVVVVGAAFPAAGLLLLLAVKVPVGHVVVAVVTVAGPFAHGHGTVVYFVCGWHDCWARAIARCRKQ